MSAFDRIFRNGGSAADVLAHRREKFGLAPVAKDQGPASPTSSESPAEAATAAPPVIDENLDDTTGSTGRFLAIAQLCGRRDLDVEKIAAQLVNLLPSALDVSAPCSCRIEIADSVWWSPGYARKAHELSAPLKVADTDVGSILVNYAGEPKSASARESLLSAVAGLINQMLERRADRDEVIRLRKELQRRQLVLTQAQRLVKVGTWEYDARTARFKWSDEIRHMTGMDVGGKEGREAETSVAKCLRGAVEEALRMREPLVHEFTCTLSSGETRWLHSTGDAQIENAEATQIIGIIRDITEEKETLHYLTHAANHDVLTALPNRRYFQERIEAALGERHASGGLLTLDIDGFKTLNDISGHDVGDMLLRDFARRLRKAAGTAFAARLGGDEFAALFPGLDRARAEYLARTLVAELGGPIDVNGRTINVRVSAGFAMFPADGHHAEDLIKSADLALYSAKARGGDMLVNYVPEFRKEQEQRLTICTDVQGALSEKQIVPFYQPKIHLESGLITGFEALLRWNHPTGIRSPGAILPALEDPELSRALCDAMLDRIIADAARWQAKGLPFGRIAFNASSSEFGEFDLADHLLRRLSAMGLKTSRLGVEVTETVFLNGGAESIRATLGKLQEAGIEIALDDFGTGFASLTHLQEFPVDIIKIDQSFIRGLTTDAGSRGITSAVLGLGRSFGKHVVAEGVETEEQAQLLRLGGCDQVQGFLFARPMPAGDVPDFLENWVGADKVVALSQKAA